MAGSTHFGYRTVAEDEKATLVRGVFDSVASRYDLMNDLMSGGLHRLWKKEMVSWLGLRPYWRILDVAGGTGDIAFRMLDEAPCHVTVCDINRQMLEEGRARAIDRALPHDTGSTLDFLCADAEALPMQDGAQDAYTIAFGIRNVTHIEQALAEAYRVLRTGGRFLCLEFSQLPNVPLQKFYDAYSFAMIPRMGALVTGSGEPYQYLIESIRRFPDADTFAAMMRAAGFGNVQYRRLSAGVVAIHSGRKL